MSGSSDSQDRLAELAREFVRRWLAGEQPSVSEYADRYPDLAEPIRFFFPLLVPDNPRRETETPAVSTTPELSRPKESPAEESRPDRLGGYRILREIGRGGMGIVYEALQEDLGRHVALKVLPASVGFHPVLLERFRREARAAARLHHTNIVPVFGTGEDQGVSFYVMQYIEGEALHRVLNKVRSRRASGPAEEESTREAEDRAATVADLLCHASIVKESASPDTGQAVPPDARPAAAASSFVAVGAAAYYRNVAQIGMQVADALDHAHGQGVLHRDIKPANLLLDTRGNIWVADFGLARLEDAEGLSRPGDVVGTIRYMAPERFEGVSCPPSDIYSLGATLYELLTLQPPFVESNRERLIEQVVRGEVRPPRALDPHIPRDLDTIVGKAMARELGRRYTTARELTDDLGRFLRGEPIRARRVGLAERAVKWARRRPAVTALLGACITLFLIGFALVAWQWRAARSAEHLANDRAGEAETRRQEADDARRQLSHALDRAETNSYYHAIGLAHHEWLAGNPNRVEEILADCPAALRHWEWRYLLRLGHSYSRLLRADEGASQAATFSPDGAFLATADRYGPVHVWDARTGRPKSICKGLVGGALRIAWSPDSRRLAAGGADGFVHVWDAAAGTELFRLRGHANWVHEVIFSPDGSRLASAGQDRTVRLWEARAGAVGRVLPGHPAAVQALVFSRDGTLLASGDWDGNLCLWNVKTGTAIRRWAAHAGTVTALSCSSVDEEFATASQDRTVRIWSWKTGGEVRTLHGHEDAVRCASYSPDGKRLATAGADRQIKIWDLKSGKELYRILGHVHGVRTLAFSPDGKQLASCDDKGCELWPADDVQDALPLRGHTNMVWGVAFSSDSRHLATASWDKTVKVWDVAAAKEIITLHGHTHTVHGVAFRPMPQSSPPNPSPQLATASWDKTVKVWNVNTGKVLATLEGHTEAVTSVAYSPDGKLLASAGIDRTIRLWDADTHKHLRTLKGHEGPIFSIAFSPDDRHLASGAGADAVRIWSISGDEVRRLSRGQFAVAYSPDGRHLATLGPNEQLILWDAETGQEVQVLRGHQGTAPAVAFSPDGRRLVTVGHDRTLRVWDRQTWRELLNLHKHEKDLRAVAFSPDGQYVATAGDDRTVRLWVASPADDPPNGP
jgi:WD40 repeat protein/serine/threonine protein kinase